MTILFKILTTVDLEKKTKEEEEEEEKRPMQRRLTPLFLSMTFKIHPPPQKKKSWFRPFKQALNISV